MNNKWNVAFYIRLSVEDGDDKVESNSVSNQRNLLKLFINDKNEFNYMDEYVDDGYSGTTFNRPSFIRMLDDIKNGKINTIIVKDLSRFGRNYIEVGNYLEQIFPLYNLRFIAINDNIDSYKDPNSLSNVIVPFKNLLNDEYARDISNKVKSSKKVKMKRGEYLGPAGVYGYQRDLEDKHHLIIDKEVANVVKTIFKLYLEGNGRSKIAKYLNDNGILSPAEYQAKKYNWKKNLRKDGEKVYWNERTIANILKNEIYCGHMIQGREKVISYKVHKKVNVPKEDWYIVKNTHEAIISEKDFKKVNDILLSRDMRVGNNGKLYMFSGHLRCSECGNTLTKKYYKSRNYELKTGKKKYTFWCSSYLRSGKRLCHKHRIGNLALENMVFKVLKKQIELVIKADDIIIKLKKEKSINYEQNMLVESKKKILDELNRYETLKKESYEDWKLGILNEIEYKSYSTDYTKKIIELTNEKKNIDEKIAKSNFNNINDDWINEFKKYKNITELNRDVIDSLIDYVEVDDDEHINVVFKFKDEFQSLIDFIENNK